MDLATACITQVCERHSVGAKLLAAYGNQGCTCDDDVWLVKASDNTRAVGEQDPWLLPADQTRRVILCSGQIYYTLSRARRSRQIRDIILVRLEQIAPFPHDLVTQVPAASGVLPLTLPNAGSSAAPNLQGSPGSSGVLRGRFCV